VLSRPDRRTATDTVRRECELTFGRDGKPVYISGPHDDGERIIRKLRRGLGDGNYDFVHMISG
jgi:hypothetical protein